MALALCKLDVLNGISKSSAKAAGRRRAALIAKLEALDREEAAGKTSTQQRARGRHCRRKWPARRNSGLYRVDDKSGIGEPCFNVVPAI